MTDRLLDDLGRALARPITRRRTIRIFLAGGAALALPTLRPRISSAGTQVCIAASDKCFERTCAAFETCCYTTDPTSMGCQYGNPHCCNPCDPTGNKCDPSTGGCIGGGGDTCAKCCSTQGEATTPAPPCACCPPGQIFTGNTGGFHTGGRCCTPQRGQFRTPCGIRRGDCRRITRESAETEFRECDAELLGSVLEVSAKKASARHHACMRRVHKFFTKRMRRCPQSPDPKACAEGVCGKDLRCTRECADSPRLERESGSEASTGELEVVRVPPKNQRATSSAASISPAELRSRISASAPRLNRTYRRVRRELREIPVRNNLLPETDLAKAYGAYLKEIRRLRRRIAAGNGGRPQRLTLKMLDASIAANTSFEASARARTIQKQERLHDRGMRALNRAGKLAPAASRALGCGKTCA